MHTIYIYIYIYILAILYHTILYHTILYYTMLYVGQDVYDMFPASDSHQGFLFRMKSFETKAVCCF